MYPVTAEPPSRVGAAHVRVAESAVMLAIVGSRGADGASRNEFNKKYMLLKK